jgi:hypothetical protein
MVTKTVLGLAAAIVAAGSTLGASAAQHRALSGKNEAGHAEKYLRNDPEHIVAALRTLPSRQRQEIVANMHVSPRMRTEDNLRPEGGGGYAKYPGAYGYAGAIDKSAFAVLAYLKKHPELIVAAIGALPFRQKEEVKQIVV